MRRHVPFFPLMSRKDSLWLNLLGLPVLGVVLVIGVALGVHDLQTRIAYETDALTAPGTVVEIVAGSPVVEFLPEENGFVPVVTTARGTFERGAETDVEVTYLAGDPSEAALENGMWIPPILWGAIALAVAIAVMLLAPEGPRVVLYRLRRKAYQTGPTATGEAARRAVRWRRWLTAGSCGSGSASSGSSCWRSRSAC
ncbi:hypothetical protein [Nocardiopsis ganjiahuensis]|uniref:hypothetical protein n=1 Tax=Nocardiopsis ganjiahuensis TaxID=239984 RepID=UPI00034526AA|nr:hypothetical protein [Nocardiopsis ganjiahuensis]